MNNEKTIETKGIDTKVLGFSTVAAILGATFAIAMSTSAASPENLNVRSGRSGFNTEQSQELEAAIENGDYAAWRQALGSTAVPEARGSHHMHMMTNVVTEANFSTFAAMHEAMRSGDIEKAQELHKELGLPERLVGLTDSGDGRHVRGQGRGMGMMSDVDNE
jgi:hypothetical protein